MSAADWVVNVGVVWARRLLVATRHVEARRGRVQTVAQVWASVFCWPYASVVLVVHLKLLWRLERTRGQQRLCSLVRCSIFFSQAAPHLNGWRLGVVGSRSDVIWVSSPRHLAGIDLLGQIRETLVLRRFDYFVGSARRQKAGGEDVDARIRHRSGLVHLLELLQLLLESDVGLSQAHGLD